MEGLAPLVIFTYNRPIHTAGMLKAVSGNMLAEDTEVFIFSDGPKSEGAAKGVQEVRQLLKKFKDDSPFKEVTIIESECNKGLANSIISGVTDVIQKYGKVIVLEDDLITSPVFLKFMNDCLNFYKENQRIWSIGGTVYFNKALENYDKDVWAHYRGESCGWATWCDRWEKVDWSMSNYEALMKDSKRKKLYQQRAGEDIIVSLKKQKYGLTDSWAVRWVFQQLQENMLTICPKKSLVDNIGYDGSGTHSTEAVSSNVAALCEHFTYKLENVEPEEALVKEFCACFYRSILSRIWEWGLIGIKRLR